MSAIRVDSPGLFTTVQDLGRPGYGTLGISAAGAADPVALRVGNALAGNPPGAAALEMTLLGGAFSFPDGATIALAGAEFEGTLDGEPVCWWAPIPVRAGQVLRIREARNRARCYLCVRGGIEVPPVFGSRSTHVPSGLGGFEGRALRRGDMLPIGEAPAPLLPKHVDIAALYPNGPLRITATVQTSWFSGEQQHLLSGTGYRVSPASDRMGLRLEGPPIRHGAGSMRTEGVALGAIQVPAGGEPIILFVDQQTTGGYPKIANVIAADLHRLGQLRPRDEVRFEWVLPQTARACLLELERALP